MMHTRSIAPSPVSISKVHLVIECRHRVFFSAKENFRGLLALVAAGRVNDLEQASARLRVAI